ncbi:hypothetical protein [Streptomyces sp. NPDC045714]|uniref:hypothetical protein n=1 Tax=Streptomyces sp. NPDC045714 TaxID=3154913 RepID=UPI0033D7555D
MLEVVRGKLGEHRDRLESGRRVARQEHPGDLVLGRAQRAQLLCRMSSASVA